MRIKVLFLLALAVNLISNFAYAEDSTIIDEEKHTKLSVENDTGIKLESDGKTILIQDLKGKIQKEEIKEKETPFKIWIDGDYATGDWKGLRTKLEEKGITLGSEYVNDNFIKMRGGLNNKRPFKAEGLINTSVELDTGKLGLWKGGKLFTNFTNLHGKGITDNYLGGLQAISSIEAERHSQLIEYYYEQSLLNEKIRVKIGRQDANAEFCSLEGAGDNINSSFGLIPNIPIPAYPATGLGVATVISPNKFIDIKYGFFDGNSRDKTNAFKTAFDGENGGVHITEIAFKPEIKGYQGNYIAGFWAHTGDLDEITDSADVRTFQNNKGFYTAFEQKIFKEKDNNEEGLSIIGQFGWAPPDRNEISRYYGAGLKYTGLIPKRNNDVTGIATAIADVSNRYKTIDGRTQETILELFHKIQLTNWFALQPSMQFVFNPGGDGKNAFAMGLRSIITF